MQNEIGNFFPDFVYSIETSKKQLRRLRDISGHYPKLLELMVEGEEIVVILPSYEPSKFLDEPALAVVTNFRVLRIRGYSFKPEWMAYDEIGRVRPMVMPDTHFVVQMTHSDVMDYEPFAGDGSLASSTYLLNTISWHFSAKIYIQVFLDAMGYSE